MSKRNLGTLISVIGIGVLSIVLAISRGFYFILMAMGTEESVQLLLDSNPFSIASLTLCVFIIMLGIYTTHVGKREEKEEKEPF